MFPEPQAFNYGGELVKILSLDGNGKMSKSENENATIYLCDSDEQIVKKIKKAKLIGTDKIAVLITGKGTDPYIMRANGKKEKWSDAEVTREELGKIFSL